VIFSSVTLQATRTSPWISQSAGGGGSISVGVAGSSANAAPAARRTRAMQAAIINLLIFLPMLLSSPPSSNKALFLLDVSAPRFFSFFRKKFSIKTFFVQIYCTKPVNSELLPVPEDVFLCVAKLSAPFASYHFPEPAVK
jgi:hypothetical protein